LGKVLDKDVIKDIMIPVLSSASEDKSWRVRLNLAKKFNLIAESFGSDFTNAHLIQIFSSLLRDGEVEVRIAATINIRSLLKTTHVDKINA